MVDFNLLGDVPNYLGLYKQSYDAGRKQAYEGRVQNALKSAGSDLVGAEKELMSLGAFDDAAQLRRIRVDQARAKAAQAAAALDYKGAATAAGEAGDTEDALRLAGAGRAADLGAQAASGDIAGASTGALQAGDIDLAGQFSKLDDASKARAKEQNDTLGAFAYGIRNRPPAERDAARQAFIPFMEQQGYPPQLIERVKAASLDDATLDAFIGQAMTLKQAIDEEYKSRPVVLGNGAVLSERDGTVVAKNAKTFAPPRASSKSSSASTGLPPGYEPVK